MVDLNGYIHNDKWNDVANGQWIIAEKKGERYFIKRFKDPKYFLEGELPPKSLERKRTECAEWEASQRNMMKLLKDFAKPSGNLVVAVDLFRVRNSYYKVNYAIDTSSLSLSDVARLSENDKLMLLRTMTHSLKTLHRVNIVHGDLKPANILITKSTDGHYITKIIDFDDSYFSGNPPSQGETMGTEKYYSPELGKYISEEDESYKSKITTKSDIFALGLIFHEYLTGSLPKTGKTKKGTNIAPYVLINEGKSLPLASTIKPHIKKLLSDMLSQNPDDRPTILEVFDRLKLEETKPHDIYIKDHGNGQYSFYENGVRKRTFSKLVLDTYCIKYPGIDIRK